MHFSQLAALERAQALSSAQVATREQRIEVDVALQLRPAQQRRAAIVGADGDLHRLLVGGDDQLDGTLRRSLKELHVRKEARHVADQRYDPLQRGRVKRTLVFQPAQIGAKQRPTRGAQLPADFHRRDIAFDDRQAQRAVGEALLGHQDGVEGDVARRIGRGDACRDLGKYLIVHRTADERPGGGELIVGEARSFDIDPLEHERREVPVILCGLARRPRGRLLRRG